MPAVLSTPCQRLSYRAGHSHCLYGLRGVHKALSPIDVVGADRTPPEDSDWQVRRTVMQWCVALVQCFIIAMGCESGRVKVYVSYFRFSPLCTYQL
jgi:hypothetical protein